MDWLVDAVRLLSKGGYVMIPLMICSIGSVAILLERHFTVKSAQTDVSDTIRRAEDAIYDGNYDKAIDLVNSKDTPVTRVIFAGLHNRHLGERGVERAMEEQGIKEMAALTSRLSYLDTIITISPLLGLLGTVTGMISAFHVIATKEGISTPTAITGGVAEALVATATGLAIAIVTLVGYNALQEKIKHISAGIETVGTGMVNLIADAGEAKGEITRLSA